VIVATAVFAFFLGSVIAAVLADAHSGPVNKRRLQAANLAREGMTLVTQIRDTAWLRGGVFTVNPSSIPTSVTLDSRQYTRTITTSPQSILGGANNANLVTVDVSWAEGGEDKHIVIRKILTDWKAI